jgi:phage shock protein A
MTLTLPQDTPIRRASLHELSVDQITELVERMRERRMRLHSAWEEAKEAKAKIAHDKAVDRYQHVLDMVEKKLKTVDAGLEALSKYCNELKVLQLTIGD